MENVENFMEKARGALKHPRERQRLEALLLRWAAAWQGPRRNLTHTVSHHGACLHFNQLIGKVWSQVFTFHASPRQGVFMKGPDTDRARKSHRHRDTPLDPSGLDALFDAWTRHPEARPAGNAVEFHLEEVADDTWEACLQEALTHLG